MSYWITYITDEPWKSKTASGIIANQLAAKAVIPLGFKRLTYPRLPVQTLREESWSDRQTRIEAMISGVQAGDTVIVQYPTWINHLNFEMQFFDCLKKIPNVKLAALVWDILSWVQDDRERDYKGDPSLWLLNKFDLVIAANAKMARRLREEGGVTRPMLAMDLTDLPYHGPLIEKKFEKRLYYVSTVINPNMLADYQAKTPFYIIGPNWAVKEHPEHIHLVGQKMSDEIPGLFTGGFGVVSYGRGGTYKGMLHYGEYNNPMKLSLYLASGLPPIVLANSAHAKWIQERGIGLVLNELNEIDDVLAKLSAADYHTMLEHLKPWQRAVSNGYFVKRACLEAIRVLNLRCFDQLTLL